MKTAYTPRYTHLKNDLEALVAWLSAEDTANNIAHEFDCDPYPSYAPLAAAVNASMTASKSWHKIPRKRRLRAEKLHEAAMLLAGRAASIGGKYSGETVQQIRWDTTCRAYTSKDAGSRYSKRKCYRRTDAQHIVMLDVQGVLAMEKNGDLIEQSAADGLHLIALYPIQGSANVFKATWVRTGIGKTITSEDGWVAYDRKLQLANHSYYSATDAKKGLRKKAKLQLAQELHEQALHSLNPKSERRARLIARLCAYVDATTDDAKKLGYCQPGIMAFRRLYGFGQSASLPELLATGNPHAIKLALYVARRVALEKRKLAAKSNN